ncbi:hypothetical protein [Sphingomonas profundi]|uniref:hypothetical protein n=1 Tax=Alterirhizorhabdus profundi TaxID=2681549 RepID=UPI0012E6F265|nr:hypothetical protein [Sphingomonas profundi]
MRAAAAILALAATCPATAADLAPGPAAITAAAGEARAMVAAHEGYRVKDHVLYAVRDARGIDPADGSVDAIVVATPWERTRHAAFIAAYTERPVSPEDAYRRAGLPAGTLAILIYAHGRDAEDRDFADRFGPARLAFDGATVPASGPPDHSPLSEAVYPLAAGARERRVATVTYRFDLAALAGAGQRAGRLQFTDASGKAFDVPIDLARFR